jgi:hypothetical protein
MSVGKGFEAAASLANLVPWRFAAGTPLREEEESSSADTMFSK